MALRAFVQTPTPALTPDQVEKAAKTIHDRFLEDNRYKNPDPAMKPWPELRPDLEDSNRMQAAYIATFLERVGYGVEAGADSTPLVTFSGEEIEKLAEMEHGRWIIERLLSGWRYGPTRDPTNKRSNYLVAWSALKDELVKGYDREAAISWPGILEQAGLRIVR